MTSWASGWLNELSEVDVGDVVFHQFFPWLLGKGVSLGWTFVSGLVSYSPFLLMTLIENKLDELRIRDMQQRSIRAREDFAMEEMSAFKDGDEEGQYLRPGEPSREEKTKDDEEEEEEQ